MIRVYQGVDIVEIARFRDVAMRHETFLPEIFTERERAYCESRKDPYLHFAGRFAAKESFAKALGTGFSGSGIDGLFREIEVIPSASGRPELSVIRWAAKIVEKRKIRQWSVSISHASQYAVAAVVLVGT